MVRASLSSPGFSRDASCWASDLELLVRRALDDRPEGADLLEVGGIEQVVGANQLHRPGHDLPRELPAHRPPHELVVVGQPVGGHRVVGDGFGRIDGKALALFDHRGPVVGDDASGHLGRSVAAGDGQLHGSVGALVAVLPVAEDHLGQRERVLVEGGHLVLVVGPSVRGAERPLVEVRGQLDEQRVQHGRRLVGDLGVLGEVGEQDEAHEVLHPVHVGQPLAESVAGAKGDPALDQRACMGDVFVAGHVAVGEGLVGKLLAGDHLVGQEHEQVVLGPVVLVVDDALGRGLGVPVLERQELLGDGVAKLLVEFVAVAHIQLQQAVDPEVVGVAELIERREGAVEVGHRRRRGIPGATRAAGVFGVRHDRQRIAGAEGLAGHPLQIVAAGGRPVGLGDALASEGQRVGGGRRSGGSGGLNDRCSGHQHQCGSGADHTAFHRRIIERLRTDGAGPRCAVAGQNLRPPGRSARADGR